MLRLLPALAVLTALTWWLSLAIEGNGWLYWASAIGFVLMGGVARPWWLALLLGEAIAVSGLVVASTVLWNSEASGNDTGSCDPGCISLGGGVILIAIAVLVLTSAGILARLVFGLIRSRRRAAAA